MTKRRTNTSWRGALFNALGATADGIAGFCTWAERHRNRTIAESTLYKRLDGAYPGERVPIEDAEIITEYCMRDANAKGMALNWLAALGARWNMILIEIDPPAPDGALDVELAQIVDKAMRLFEKGGRLAGTVNRSTADGEITSREADEINEQIDLIVRHLVRMKCKVARAAGKTVNQTTQDSE